MQKKILALGRLKSGQMNKTEAAYAQELERQKREGEISWYRFECMKLKVADGKCWYSPDFLVMTTNGELQLHEVKGAKAIFQDDAKVKCKVIATDYPFRLFVCFPQRTGWIKEEL